MPEQNPNSWWNELREHVAVYLRARLQLTRLQAYEKIAKVTGVVISFFILALIVGVAIIFILLMVGGWVTEITGSVAIGYSAVAVVVIGTLIFLAVKRRTLLEKPITNAVITALFDDEDFHPKEPPAEPEQKNEQL